MSKKERLSDILSSSKTFFPSIPSPRSRRHNKSVVLNKQSLNTLNPQSLTKLVVNDNDKITKEQKVVSNFLLRYLSRKETQQLKWNAINHVQEINAVKSQTKMDPKFRRVYLKKMKVQKKDLVSRFIIGNQSNYSQNFLKNSLTIER